MRRLLGPLGCSLPAFSSALLLSALTALSGCQLQVQGAKSVVPDNGVMHVQGIAQGGHIARNAAGMPLVEAGNLHDLLFTLGYSHASDRLSQMLQLRLLGQGRLAELRGAEALNLDRLMRSINLSADAQSLYKNAPEDLQKHFAVYARGINAYLYQMRDALPPELARAHYQPDYWSAEDSALLFSLFSFSQSGNVSAEVLALAFAQQLEAEQLPWLLPVYPDEPLALDEASKLLGLTDSVIRNQALRDSTVQLLETLNQLATLNSLQAPLASSWVSSAQHSEKRRSLLALNTLRTPASNTIGSNALPTPYSWINLHSPQLKAAGLSIPGVPLLLSGFNGQLAYSSSAVMADTRDVFVEKLRQHNGRLEYFVDDQWQPAQRRSETFAIRGQQPIRETLYSTAHGPLLVTLPKNSGSGYGLALQRAYLAEDASLNILWQLLASTSVEQATQILPRLRTLPANILVADATQIAWQVTGTYPNRRNSRGVFPSAGWDANMAWDGYAESVLHPYDQDPAQGWLSAANQRLTQPGYGMQLSSSWASPERAENLAQQLSKKPVAASLAQQSSAQHRPWLVAQLQQMLNGAGMPEALKHSLEQLPSQQRTAAQESLQAFLAIDAQRPLSNEQAAWLQRFLMQAQEQLFQQELHGMPDSVQQAFALHNQHNYPAWLDHLLGRADSPFWQTVSGSKAQFLVDNLLSSRQASGIGITATQPLTRQLMLVDFSRPMPLAAASFSGQSDNPYSPYYQLDTAVAGKLYPLPTEAKGIKTVYGTQRLTLLPAP